MKSQPNWFWDILQQSPREEGQTFWAGGQEMIVDQGIPRARNNYSKAQGQTQQAFGYKWSRRDTFEGSIASYMKTWLHEKYGVDPVSSWLDEYGAPPVLLDAGCGASVSGLALFEPVIDSIRYIGADISSAVDMAALRFEERGLEAGFIQCDLTQLPLPPESVDIVFSEGVLHHTDSTRAALAAVTGHLKVGGRILFYVYRRKGPIREFTDDYVRDKLQAMTPEEGWTAMEPLSKLGRALGELNIELDVPEAVDLLDIPAGRINLQRLFYWHVFKAFYRAEMTLDEMNHINYDWFAPKNAHRQSVDEVRKWCAELGLRIEREFVEEAGITIVAQKAGRP